MERLEKHIFNNMRAHLMTKEVWGLVKGEDTQPGPDEPKELKQWRKDRHGAAGAIFLHLTEGQQSVVQSMTEDPVQMWATLETTYLQKRPSIHCNAYDNLFSIRKREDESLTALMSRVNAVQQVKARCPSAFTIDDLDGELGTMALLCALPEDFRSFTSSLMLLPQLDYPTVKDAVFLEEQNRQPRPSDAHPLL
jgi:hypothetical protein